MDKYYNTAVNNVIQKLSESLGRIKELSMNQPIWSEIAPINSPSPRIENHPITYAIGVYKIIYKPTMEVMSIGCGNVSARKSRHMGVFKNDGKTIISLNGSPSGSMTGIHMYKYDKDINNWLCQWCDVGNKELSEMYETILQQQENPSFNNESMAGK